MGSVIHPSRDTRIEKWVLAICALALLLLALGMVQLNNLETPRVEVCDLHFSSGAVLEEVPVARTREQQARGLMHQEDVGNGMLFVWPEADLRAFWMRDTPAPLSIGFFAADGTLFAIKHMEPETDDYHFSARPAQYALELAQGEFERKGLPVGSRMVHRDCRTVAQAAVIDGPQLGAWVWPLITQYR